MRAGGSPATPLSGVLGVLVNIDPAALSSSWGQISIFSLSP
jgi:hypothetical protein